MIAVGYSYELNGDLKLKKEDYIVFCRDNDLEAYLDDMVNEDSLREFLLEKFDLVKMANGGKLAWVEEIEL